MQKKTRKPKSAPVPWWRLAVVGAAAVACYIQSAGYQFVYDDGVQIVLNPRIRSFSHVISAFTENFWAFAAAGSFTNYYRPLQTVTYMFGYALGGLSPGPYHALNILLHCLTSLGVFWLALEMLGSAEIALWGALLFAVHPMHTESVTWIAGVTDVGCGLFYVVSLAAYFRYRKSQSRAGENGGTWVALSLISFLCALLYKEMALTLPLAIAAAEVSFHPKEAAYSARLKRVWPFLGVFLVYVVLRINALGAFARTVQSLPMTFPDRLMTTLYLVGRYLQDAIVPVTHNAYHVFRPFSLMAWNEWLPPCSVLAVSLVLLWVLWRRDRRYGFLAFWVGLVLIPVLNLGGVGQNVYAERYLYIPSVGLCVLVAALFDRFVAGVKVRTIALSAITVACFVLTVRRNPAWEDDKALYAATLSVSPDAVPIRNNLGKMFFEQRNYAEAGRQFAAASDSWSRAYAHSERDGATTLLGLSSVANAEGKWNEAVTYAERAKNLMPAMGGPYQTLGMLMAKRENYAQAEALLRKAVALEPGNAVARVNLGSVLLNRGDAQGAEREFRAAVELDPKLAGSRVALANLLIRTNRHSEALQALRQALTLDPSNFQARELLRLLGESGH